MTRTMALVLALAMFALCQPCWAGAKRFALLVGVNNYEGTGLQSLRHTVRDMEELQAELKKEGFEVELLSNREATKVNVAFQLKRIQAKRGVGDLLLVAMSGHGVQQKNAKGEEDAFFCPGGCDKANVDSLISLTDFVQSLGAKGVNLLLVDACRNDPRKGVKGITGNELEGRLPANTAMLFSCSAGQESFETNAMSPNDPSKGHGVFFFHVLKGLRGEAKNAKGEVTWLQLVDYVTENVDDQAKKWFDDRARQQAKDRGVSLVELRFQSPHLLNNMNERPVLARRFPGLETLVARVNEVIKEFNVEMEVLKLKMTPWANSEERAFVVVNGTRIPAKQAKQRLDTYTAKFVALGREKLGLEDSLKIIPTLPADRWPQFSAELAARCDSLLIRTDGKKVADFNRLANEIEMKLKKLELEQKLKDPK